MYIETERLIIRSMELSDENAFIEMASDGSLDEDIFGGWVDRYGEYQIWMKDYIKEVIRLDKRNNPKSDYLAYVIEDKAQGIPVGSVGCSYYDESGEIGMVYFVGTKYRGKGYATEAAAAYAKYFLEQYDVSRMVNNIRAENVASWKTAEKAGFVHLETKMFRDIFDDEEKLYRFYECVLKS